MAMEWKLPTLDQSLLLKQILLNKRTELELFTSFSSLLHFRSENDSSIPSISKAERDQEMQKYYRADLIRHLTDLPATQLEKQVRF